LTRFRYVNSIAMSFIVSPLSNIFLTLFIFPESITLHTTIFKISYIIFVIKFQAAFSVSSIILEISYINRSIWKFLIPFSWFKIKTKISLINGIFSKINSQSMFHISIHPTKIQKLRLIDDCKILLIRQVLHIEKRLM